MLKDDFLDTPIDYDNLIKLGSMMGSGGLIVMDEDDCMVDVAKFYLGFCVDESCGKCAPCRVGGKTMYDILDKITKGQGEMEDLEKLETIGAAMKRGIPLRTGSDGSKPDPVDHQSILSTNTRPTSKTKSVPPGSVSS